MKSSTHVISQKTFGFDVFHLNKHNYVGKTILLQNYFHLKTRIMLKAFVTKFILHVY